MKLYNAAEERRKGTWEKESGIGREGGEALRGAGQVTVRHTAFTCVRDDDKQQDDDIQDLDSLPTPADIMTEPIHQAAETIQTASVNQNPSAAVDVNPTPEKRQVSESAISDTDSIPSDVVDPSRMVRTVVRQRNLPPLPDLRFEQSYLASLKDADTWGRVAWITTRDQVRFPRVWPGHRVKEKV